MVGNAPDYDCGYAKPCTDLRYGGPFHLNGAGFQFTAQVLPICWIGYKRVSGHDQALTNQRSSNAFGIGARRWLYRCRGPACGGKKGWIGWKEGRVELAGRSISRRRTDEPTRRNISEIVVSHGAADNNVTGIEFGTDGPRCPCKNDGRWGEMVYEQGCRKGCIDFAGARPRGDHLDTVHGAGSKYNALNTGYMPILDTRFDRCDLVRNTDHADKPVRMLLCKRVCRSGSESKG